MHEDPVAEISATREAKPPATAAYRVLYDGQCEICQAGVSWLKALDHEKKTVCLPISAETLAGAPLEMDDCLRELHVVTPEGEVCRGWDAVTRLARLFPATRIIGALGQMFPFRNAGRLAYRFVATNRYSLSKCRGGACRIAKPEAVRRNI